MTDDMYLTLFLAYFSVIFIQFWSKLEEFRKIDCGFRDIL